MAIHGCVLCANLGIHFGPQVRERKMREGKGQGAPGQSHCVAPGERRVPCFSCYGVCSGNSKACGKLRSRHAGFGVHGPRAGQPVRSPKCFNLETAVEHARAGRPRARWRRCKSSRYHGYPRGLPLQGADQPEAGPVRAVPKVAQAPWEPRHSPLPTRPMTACPGAFNCGFILRPLYLLSALREDLFRMQRLSR